MRKIERTAFRHPGRPLGIAHRGARSLAPENTLAAAKKALELGADLWELDVQVSADGVLMVFHDDTMERTTNLAEAAEFAGRPPVIHEFTRDELRRLDCGSWFAAADPFGQIRAGRVSQVELESYRGVKMPTLEEALVFTRDNDWGVNVEIKDLEGLPGHDRVVRAALDLIAGLGLTGRTLLSSFNSEYVRQAKEILPELAAAWLVETEADGADPLPRLEDCGAEAYHPFLGVITPRQIEDLRSRGYLVNVWNLNAESDMRNLLAWGVDGVFTDFPQVLMPIIRNGGY